MKAVQPGAVKTRLAAALGPSAAAELYRLLAEAEVRGTAPRRGEYGRLFFFSPWEARADVESWFPGEAFLAQRGADLGARMQRAFDEGFRRGARRVAIIGGDVPALSRERVREAFRSLEDHDLALGPARDGGYYLLALSQPRPELFRGLAWGTPSVLAATVERARGLRVRLLPPLPDIDTLEDVRREWTLLARLLRPHPELRRGIARALARTRSGGGRRHQSPPPRPPAIKRRRRPERGPTS